MPSVWLTPLNYLSLLKDSQRSTQVITKSWSNNRVGMKDWILSYSDPTWQQGFQELCWKIVVLHDDICTKGTAGLQSVPHTTEHRCEMIRGSFRDRGCYQHAEDIQSPQWISEILFAYLGNFYSVSPVSYLRHKYNELSILKQGSQYNKLRCIKTPWNSPWNRPPTRSKAN